MEYSSLGQNMKDDKIPTSGAAMFNVQEEHEKEISPREKMLLARKKNLQRQKRSKLPKKLRWERNCLIRTDTIFVKNVLNLTSFGKPASYAGVLCPSRLSYDG